MPPHVYAKQTRIYTQMNCFVIHAAQIAKCKSPIQDLFCTISILYADPSHPMLTNAHKGTHGQTSARIEKNNKDTVRHHAEQQQQGAAQQATQGLSIVLLFQGDWPQGQGRRLSKPDSRKDKKVETTYE